MLNLLSEFETGNKLTVFILNHSTVLHVHDSVMMTELIILKIQLHVLSHTYGSIVVSVSKWTMICPIRFVNYSFPTLILVCAKTSRIILKQQSILSFADARIYQKPTIFDPYAYKIYVTQIVQKVGRNIDLE